VKQQTRQSTGTFNFLIILAAENARVAQEIWFPFIIILMLIRQQQSPVFYYQMGKTCSNM